MSAAAREVATVRAIPGLAMVALKLIDPDPDQPRSDPGDLDELRDSILELGIVEPLVVRRAGNRLRLIAGERRWRAANLAGLIEVPVIIRNPRDQVETQLLQLTENVHRKQMNPIEEARALRRLVRAGVHRNELAERCSKSLAWVSDRLALLELPKQMQTDIAKGLRAAYEGNDVVRKMRRVRAGKDADALADRGWDEPWHFTGNHPLASKARVICDMAGHNGRRRYGTTGKHQNPIACGKCWEHVIREDERQHVTAPSKRGGVRG